ncbi:MAG: tetratricopeptide repeat protein [Candidatus Eisenbacteria bacterium]|nr:tetratricopeptide repeat protein [Candidatus Eisenbacteria bacterium]
MVRASGIERAIGDRCRRSRRSMPPTDGPRQDPLRRILFWIVLLLIPLLLLGLAEVGLRLAGAFAPPALFLEVEVGTVRGYRTNPDVGHRFFPKSMEAHMPRLGFQFFAREREPGGLRVFTVGGSSAAGFPYHSHASFTGLLETQLRQLLPGRTIETVNCAMTAIGSPAVRELLPEILDQQPDLLLIYMGHNEFYGADGVGSITAGPLHAARPLVRALLDLRLASLLRAILPERGGGAEARTGRNVMETMVAERRIRADSPLREIARRSFRDNLEAVLEQAQSAGVPVLLCTVASNLGDQPPFGSAHPAAFGSEAAFESHWQAATEAWSAGDSLSAREAVGAALALDSTYAAARYLRGWLRERAGDLSGARADYLAAREYDTVPFRAPQMIDREIRAAARAREVALVDIDSLMTARAPGGILGEEFFLEHLHPNLQGHALIAVSIARELADRGWGAPPAQWRWDRHLSVEAYLELSGVTELDLEIGDRRVHMLTQKWPYRRDGAPPRPYLSTRSEDVVTLAEAFIQKRLPLNQAHMELADRHLEAGRADEAMREYRAAFAMFPLDPLPALKLGQLLLRAGRARAARRYLDLGLALDPRSESAILLLIQALAAEGNVQAALAVGESARRMHPASRAVAALLDTLQARIGGP